MAPSDYRFIQRADGVAKALALRYVPVDATISADEITFQDGWYIISPVDGFAQPIYHIEQGVLDGFYVPGTTNAIEEDEYRALLMAQNAGSVYSGATTYKIPGAPLSLMDYVQVVKAWPELELDPSTPEVIELKVCKTGCTPVAWGILYDYWDRNGYGELVDDDDPETPQNNYHPNVTDADVESMLRMLRLEMGTWCRSNLAASTIDSNGIHGIGWAHRRGYGNFVANYMEHVPGTTNIWDAVVFEVANARPVILNYAVDGSNIPNHSGVVYKVVESRGHKSDSFSIKTGHNDGLKPNQLRPRKELGLDYSVIAVSP